MGKPWNSLAFCWVLGSAACGDAAEPSGIDSSNAGDDTGSNASAPGEPSGHSSESNTEGGDTSVSATGGSSNPGTGADGSTTDDGTIGAPEQLSAVIGHQTLGLDWAMVQGADSYRIYWSNTPGVTPASGTAMEADAPGYVHRGLTDQTPYYYIVVALRQGVESAPSSEVEATPGGLWMLEELGHGVIDDVISDNPASKIAVAQRNHVLMFAEGYTSTDLSVFHDLADHHGDRNNDVDRWIDRVFSIEPYTTFREAFVIWTIPRESATSIRANSPDTAWAVPVNVSSSFPGVGSLPNDGETAARAWAAISEHPIPPTDFSGGGFGTARHYTGAFLIFDPEAGHASVSGRALGLRNPADSDQRLSSGFGVGHAHEFTHAFSALRDEYLENDNSPPNYSLTSNVTNTASCDEVPWKHLMAGEGINPTEELVGAFGVDAIGFHSELVCLLNGTHDNAEYYGGSGLLRTARRMCNFCREITAYRTLQRAGVIDDFDQWVAEYRAPFFERYGFSVPVLVPQTNNVNDPSAGTPIYEACSSGVTVAVHPRPSHESPATGCTPADEEEQHHRSHAFNR